MAKSNKKISGKFDNPIYKRGPSGENISKVGKEPNQAQLDALSPQNKRTGFINRLSSQVNRAVGRICEF